MCRRAGPCETAAAASRRPVGVAVRRLWVDGEADGVRALVVVTDGARHEQPAASVLVFRARESVDVDAMETELETHALAVARATAMRERSRRCRAVRCSERPTRGSLVR
jgi:hypothetical protein